MLAFGLVAGWALAGCSGSIDQPTPGNGGPGGPNNGTGNGGPNGSGPNGNGAAGANGGAAANGGGPRAGTGAGPVGSDPDDPRIAQRIWRLSPAQFNDEVARLFGAGAPQVNIPETAAEAGITNIAANAVVDLGNASIFVDGARAIASWVVAQREATTRCAQYGNDACVSSFLDWFPRSAFRRTLASDESSELRALFDALRGEYDYDYAFAGVVRAVLLSPDFLYRTELGDGDANLTPPEIANLLAFAITDRAPDDELLQAAESGDLTDPEAREAQARRLMAKSEQSWQRFFWEWLQLQTLYSQGEEVGLDPALVTQMKEEYDAFVRDVAVNGGSLRDMLSAPHTFARPELAEFYGAEHPGGSGIARVELDPAERGGLLTMGAWLVSHGKRGKDNVVRRGMNIYKHAMCNNALNPPAGVDVVAELRKLVGPDATVRETVDARGMASACGGCHRVADPIGLVFENFSSDGRWQATYPDGRPVDTAIEVDGIGAFDNAHAFATALADDLGFQRCFVQRVLQFMVGIDLGATQQVAWAQEAHERFLETNTSLEELVVAIVRHPAFIERRQETGP